VKDPAAFSLVINARGESVNDRPAFRAAMRYRRCLFPADGFYEWQREGESRRPYYVSLRSGAPMAFAGLWETWTGQEGEEMESAAIVTTRANRTLAPIHERMPVVLPQDAWDLWLDVKKVDAETAMALIAPAQDDLFTVYEVSTAVNRVANDSPALVVPLTSAPKSDPTLVHPDGAKTRTKAKDTRQGSLFQE
jgi:putative SOS response-associated peptidase YedK